VDTAQADCCDGREAPATCIAWIQPEDNKATCAKCGRDQWDSTVSQRETCSNKNNNNTKQRIADQFYSWKKAQKTTVATQRCGQAQAQA